MMRFSFFLLGIFLLVSCQNREPVVNAIDSLKEQYAPDKRVALWEIGINVRGPLVLTGQTNLPEAKENLLQTLDELEISYTDSIRVLPDPNLPAEWGIVSLSVCNIRSNPKHSAELATQCTMGQVIRIHEKQNGWYRIQTPDGYFGWLDDGGFQFLTVPVLAQLQELEKVVYLPEYGFAQASDEDPLMPVSDLMRGNILFRIQKGETMDRVVLPSGSEAFVSSTDLQNVTDWQASVEQTRSPERVIAEAEQLLGRPYLWGGTSGKGMDCSGFTKEVFYRNGLVLPRDASQQVRVGVEVPTDTTSWSGLQTGDLLFFGRKATTEKKERITHVAIYLGEGQIIHSSGFVKIESLIAGTPGYVSERVASFVRAKRILSSEVELPTYFSPPL